MRISDKTINLALQHPSDFMASYKVKSVEDYHKLLEKTGINKLINILQGIYADTDGECLGHEADIIKSVCCDRIVVLNLVEQSLIHKMPYAILVDYDI